MSLSENSIAPYTGGSVVSLESVSKWFGNVVAVSDITLNIGAGITGLLGPNGAGKTTLLRMMCGLYSVSEGKVQLLGTDPRTDHSVYKRIGIMTENESAYEFMTGLEFVRLSARLKDLKREENHLRNAIERVDMSFAMDRKISTYSRGMRQRIRLAAALVGDPELLILDEPLNGADPTQRLRFQEILHQTAGEGRSVIISSHILEEGRRGQRKRRLGRKRETCRARRFPRHPCCPGRSSLPRQDRMFRRSATGRRTCETAKRPINSVRSRRFNRRPHNQRCRTATRFASHRAKAECPTDSRSTDR